MKILIIEDKKEIDNFLKHNLETTCHVADIAIDGKEDIALNQTNKYDVIILDMMLPKKNGEQVCKKIRKNDKQTPIIVLSARSETQTKIDLLNLGADDYITKPFSFEELMARIKAVNRRPRDINTTKYLKIDNLTLDPENYTITRANKNIYLTRKEFMLLKYFLENQNKVLTRSKIMEQVWDRNADPFSNTIETHIRNLRRKIHLKKENDLIHTIPARGYKLSLEK